MINWGVHVMDVADESVNLAKDLTDSKELPSYNREPKIITKDRTRTVDSP